MAIRHLHWTTSRTRTATLVAALTGLGLGRVTPVVSATERTHERPQNRLQDKPQNRL